MENNIFNLFYLFAAVNKPDNITITVRDAVSFVVQDTENQSPEAYCEWSPPSVKGAVSLLIYFKSSGSFRGIDALATSTGIYGEQSQAFLS